MDKLIVAGALQQSLSGQYTGYHTEGEAQNTYTWMEGLHSMDQSEFRHPHWDLYSITEGEEGGALSLASFALCIPNFSSA